MKLRAVLCYNIFSEILPCYALRGVPWDRINMDNKDTEKINKNADTDTKDELGESNAMRRLKALGELNDSGDGDDKPIVRGSRLENFWYHHKWKTILISIAAVIVLICTVQLVSRESVEAYFLYIGPQYMNSADIKSFTDAVDQVTDADDNGDGKLTSSLSAYTYLNDAQIEEKKNDISANGEPLYVDASANENAYEQFSYEMMVGNSIIYILDPSIYRSVIGDDAFLKLSEVFAENELPEGAIDDFGVRLGDTKFYKYFSDTLDIPSESIICIRRVSLMQSFSGKSKAEKINEFHVGIFRDILLFEYPEGYTPTEAEN